MNFWSLLILAEIILIQLGYGSFLSEYKPIFLFIIAMALITFIMKLPSTKIK